MKVGYLGPKGTFSYEASLDYVENKEKLVEFKTIPDTIFSLENNLIDKAIVPIENSLQGCVTDAIDTLIEKEDIKVIGEIYLEIKQNLLAKTNLDLNEIEVVYSHPQAIAQCKKFLEINNLHDKVVPVESTAYAAKIVSEDTKKSACICNLSCKEEYNLEVLEEKIQDNLYNKTKFWILSKENFNKKKPEKMSMLFSVKDKPGALYNVLRIFNEFDLNLTKIESRPAKTVLGEYIFWIDVSIENGREEDAITRIKEEGIYVRVLGKY